MRRAGTRSWEFRGDIGNATNAALYVRDALRLGPFADDDVPPPLAADVPERSAQLAAGPAAAAREWLDSWRAMIVGPPSTPALPEGPLRVLYEEAYRWLGPVRFELVRSNPALLPHGIVPDAVKAVARERGVDENDLYGSLDVLLVRGEWWRVVRPGFVLASAQAVRDPAAAARLVRACLGSSLDPGASIAP